MSLMVIFHSLLGFKKILQYALRVHYSDCTFVTQMAESTGEMNTCRENNFGAYFVVIMHAYYEKKSFCYKLHNDTLK